ncbi:MAG TPA: ribosome biogenesis GTP-binding protein YihA/YsxC [Polyangiaceae bacterium]|nr:ribosome biogenesis GTP-binding protein YihA/YsxC [Polyangiaceae bacterium]
MVARPPWEIVEASFVASAREGASLPPASAPEVAFAGRSNVGKSSLMNALMGRRKLVRTSSTPGCTRAVSIFEARARDGLTLSLIDLPGYGYAQRSKTERLAWGKLVESYLSGRDALKTVVLLVDARRGLAEEERQLAAFIAAKRGTDVKTILVLTKIDRIPKSKRRAALDKLRAGRRRVLAVSATTGEGIDDLWAALRRTLPEG